MRLLFLAAFFCSLGVALPAAAQPVRAAASKASASQSRLAFATKSEANTAPLRLACASIFGKVFEANGEPLVGATLLVKGTHQVYVTDSEGKFQCIEPVYEGQVLTIGAAGYATREVPLADCSLPRLVLAKASTAHIKRKGKKAGQVTRLHNRNTNIK